MNPIERLAALGLSIQILLERPVSGSMIVYVYRRNLLESALSDCDCQHFLEKTGYNRADLDGMLTQLAYRLETFFYCCQSYTQENHPHKNYLMGTIIYAGTFFSSCDGFLVWCSVPAGTGQNNPSFPMLECVPADASGISSSTTT